MADVTFGYKEMLGRVEANSVTVTAAPDQSAEVYLEYGTSSGTYINQTTPVACDSVNPVVAVLSGLNSSTGYFYRMRYRAAGSSDVFASGTEHSFHTCRAQGEPFLFDIQADQHLDAGWDSTCFTKTQENIVADKPDFLMDLGDCFLSEKYNMCEDTLHARLKLARRWYDNICHSIPLFITIGNHEGERGPNNNGSDTCFAVRAANERIKYYPNPVPDNFFSGDTSHTAFVGQRESWYSFTWGDALIVVIDPYWFAIAKTTGTSESGWNFTLGTAQYNWLKATLRGSTAKFKFVFAHQLVGGVQPSVGGVSQGPGRGGAQYANLYEMGGYSQAGTDDWSTFRPGWDIPLHNLFVETGVNAYFHGHDHLFACEERDGVVYQECPQPGLANYTKANNAAVYGYLDSNTNSSEFGYFADSENVLPCSGHMRVTINGDSARVDYVRSFKDSSINAQNGWVNGMTAYSYTLAPKSVAIRQAAVSAAKSPLAISISQYGKTPVISFSIPQAAHVALTIMDFQGRVISRVVDATETSGTHVFRWKNGSGSAAGVYIAMLNVNGCLKTTRFSIN